jgi:hypothetical protein
MRKKMSRTVRVERVEAILPKMFQSIGMRKQYKAQLVLFYWKKIVGKDIAANTRPIRISFTTLLISAKSSAWANNLMMMKIEIISKINSFIGDTLIKDIRFCSYRESEAAAKVEELPDGPDLGRLLRKVNLCEQERKIVTEKCSEIKDEALRSRLERLYQKQLQKEKLEKQYEYHSCKRCSTLCIKEKEYCTSCERAVRQEKETKIREILLSKPWARYSDIYEQISCSREMVNRQRIRVLQRLAAKVSLNDTKSLEARTLVMLYRSLPPDQLNEENITKALHRLRNDMMWPKTFKKKNGMVWQKQPLSAVSKK